jgi:hypothetical protein
MLRRLIGLFVVISGLLALSAVIYLLFFKDYSLPQGAPEQSAPAEKTDSQQIPATPLPAAPAQPSGAQKADPLPPANQAKDDLSRLASAFAERFGSYSNQSDYDNIISLEPFMTSRMWAWAQRYVQERKDKRPADGEIYYGVSSRTIKQEFVSFDEAGGQAEIRIEMRRRESSGTMSNFSDPFDQDLSLKMVKEGGAWKVDSAIWGNDKK